jgi:hypothetical protein
MGVLKQHLQNNRRYRSDEEVLSMAWDVFMESMDVYVKGAGIKELFGSRASMLIKRMVSAERRKNRRVCSIEMVGDALPGDDSNRMVFEPFMDIYSFRGSLSPEYQLVFDDAIQSMGGNNRDKMKDDRCPLPAGRYYESKKIFQMLIEYFLLNTSR